MNKTTLSVIGGIVVVFLFGVWLFPRLMPGTFANANMTVAQAVQATQTAAAQPTSNCDRTQAEMTPQEWTACLQQYAAPTPTVMTNNCDRTQAEMTPQEWTACMQQYAAPVPTATTVPDFVAGSVDQQQLAASTPTPSFTLPSGEPTGSGDNFALWGNPDHNNPAAVERAQGGFVNTIGLGTEGWIAEPGKLLVGPDFDHSLIEGSRGAIDYFNPGNQQIFEGRPPAFFNLNEGGFVLTTAGNLTVRIDKTVIDLRYQQGHNWMFLVRGLYGDSARDTDRNIQMEYADYRPGHILTSRYSGVPNGGFVSEGQFKQITQMSAVDATNCGDGGCTRMSVFFFDINTGAYNVITRDAPDQPWRRVASNW